MHHFSHMEMRLPSRRIALRSKHSSTLRCLLLTLSSSRHLPPLELLELLQSDLSSTILAECRHAGSLEIDKWNDAISSRVRRAGEIGFFPPVYERAFGQPRSRVNGR